MRGIRTSAKAIVIHDGKLLAIKLSDGQDVWYIMPGGGQQSEETLPETVRREVAEETGIDVKVGDLAFVIEGVNGEDFHRVDLVFMCEYLGRADSVESQTDTMQTGVEWLDISTLNTAQLYPSRLRRPIMDLAAGRDAVRYLGNEEIGDPEITD